VFFAKMASYGEEVVGGCVDLLGVSRLPFAHSYKH